MSMPGKIFWPGLLCAYSGEGTDEPDQPVQRAVVVYNTPTPGQLWDVLVVTGAGPAQGLHGAVDRD